MFSYGGLKILLFSKIKRLLTCNVFFGAMSRGSRFLISLFKGSKQVQKYISLRLNTHSKPRQKSKSLKVRWLWSVYDGTLKKLADNECQSVNPSSGRIFTERSALRSPDSKSSVRRVS